MVKGTGRGGAVWVGRRSHDDLWGETSVVSVEQGRVVAEQLCTTSHDDGEKPRRQYKLHAAPIPMVKSSNSSLSCKKNKGISR